MTIPNQKWSKPTTKALFILFLAIVIGFLAPPSIPVIGTVFLVCGGIGYFRNSEPNSRSFWRIIAVAGLIIISLFGLVLLFQINAK